MKSSNIFLSDSAPDDLNLSIDQFKYYYSQGNEHLIQAIRENLSQLKQIINDALNGDEFESTIIDLRRDLNVLIKNLLKKKDSDDLAIRAHDVLLVLARLAPLNVDDPITMNTIIDEYKVFVSTGHQFDIEALIVFHNTRYYRGSKLDEKPDSKWLINPITNLKFDKLDVEHILKVAKSRMIRIDYLKRESLIVSNFYCGSMINNFFQSTEERQVLERVTEDNLRRFIIADQSIDLQQRAFEDTRFAKKKTLEFLITVGISNADASNLILNWQPPKNLVPGFLEERFDRLFSMLHFEVVASLVYVSKISAQEAFLEIDELQKWQANALNGRMYYLGLKGQHLRQWQPCKATTWQSLDRFHYCHQEALYYLICNEKCLPEHAIQEINGLHGKQPKSLKNLYKYGLRGEHLRNWKMPDYTRRDEYSTDIYSSEHDAALEYLIIDQGLAPDIVIQEINNLQPCQADALHNLYKNGLRGYHLRSWNPSPDKLFTRSHWSALSSLIDKGLAPHDAINKINGLKENEVKTIELAVTTPKTENNCRIS